jgi:Meiosis-expressed
MEGFAISGSAVRLPQVQSGSEVRLPRVQRQKSAPTKSTIGVQSESLRPRSQPLQAVNASKQRMMITDSPPDTARAPILCSKSLLSGQTKGTKPPSMQRAKAWSIEVENAYRYQLAGFESGTEYTATCNVPVVCWPETGMIKCLIVKSTGYYMYFRQTRECEDKHLNKVKLYVY